MKIEVAIAAWGHWLDRWLALNFETMRAEADDVGADLVVYTDAEGAHRLINDDRIDEIRPLPEQMSLLDRADGSHADAINRALADDHAVAPLCASHRLGRGTLAAAAHRLEAGYRACMALCIPCPVPDRIDTAPELSRRLSGVGFGWWETRINCGHPGHYAWRAPNGAVLVRPIYHHPVLLRPTRPHEPSRAADHFMTEGYLDDIGQVAQLDPVEGCIAALPSVDTADEPRGPVRPPVVPAMAEPAGVAYWMLAPTGIANGCNVAPWNLHYMAHRFWLGDPGADRLAVEMESDRVIAEIRRVYFERCEINRGAT